MQKTFIIEIAKPQKKKKRGGRKKLFNKKALQAQMVLKGMNARELSEKMGINESTFYRKMNNDGDFSRAEIAKITEVLEIDDPMKIFFATVSA